VVEREAVARGSGAVVVPSRGFMLAVTMAPRVKLEFGSLSGRCEEIVRRRTTGRALSRDRRSNRQGSTRYNQLGLSTVWAQIGFNGPVP
jgi:hypothetical protein